MVAQTPAPQASSLGAHPRRQGQAADAVRIRAALTAPGERVERRSSTCFKPRLFGTLRLQQKADSRVRGASPPLRRIKLADKAHRSMEAIVNDQTANQYTVTLNEARTRAQNIDPQLRAQS